MTLIFYLMLSTEVTKIMFVTEAEYKRTTSTANMHVHVICYAGLF